MESDLNDIQQGYETQAPGGAGLRTDFKSADQAAKEDTGTAWGFAHAAMQAAGKVTAQGVAFTERKWRENDGDGAVQSAQASLAKAYEDGTGRKTQDDVFAAKVGAGAVGAAVAVSAASTAATVAVAGGATYVGVKYHASQNDWEGKYQKAQADTAAGYQQYLGRDPREDYKAAQLAAAKAKEGAYSLGSAFIGSYREAKQATEALPDGPAASRGSAAAPGR